MTKHTETLFKYLSLYMSSSLDIASSFRLAEKRLTNKKIKKSVRQVIYSLESGKPIVESLEILKKGKYVDSVAWSMILSSYGTAHFQSTCSSVAEYIKKQRMMKSSFLGSLAYPLGVCMSAMMMIYFLMSTIFPKILPLFNSMHASLPTSTKAIMNISTFFGRYGLGGLFSIAALCICTTYLYTRSDVWKMYIEKVVVFNSLFTFMFLPREYYRISCALASLLHSGVPLLDSLRICAASSRLVTMRRALTSIGDDIEKGKKLSESIELQPLFESEWVHMLSAGEMTGTLPMVCKDLSHFYEYQCNERLQLIARWSEPVALAGSAAIILVVALSVIQPMYSLIQFTHPL